MSKLQWPSVPETTVKLIRASDCQLVLITPKLCRSKVWLIGGKDKTFGATKGYHVPKFCKENFHHNLEICNSFLPGKFSAATMVMGEEGMYNSIMTLV